MQKKVTMGVTRRTAITLLAAGLGTACVSSPNPAPTSPPTPRVQATPLPATATSTQAAPKPGGAIRTGQVGDIANLDGHYSNQLSSNTVQLCYDKLAVYDQNLQPVPMLAESWDISSDLTQYKFNLQIGRAHV